jgi:hypothetical protein
MKVLVTDGQLRKSLTAVRQLGVLGHEVWVAEDTPVALARFSKWAKGALRSPPLGDPKRFSGWLQDTLIGQRFDLVLPMDDESTEAATLLGGRAAACALVPEADHYQWFRDKGRTIDLARSLGMDTPESRLVDTEQDLIELLAQWPQGFILRPRRGAGGRGVRLVKRPDEAVAAFRRWASAGGGMIAQEWIAVSAKWDVGLLYGAHGEFLAGFVQRELRWFPEPYGASTVQVSASRPDLVAMARQLVESVGWRGPLEVEFLEAEDSGRMVLAEVNPRYWNSLAVAVAAGVDFPGLQAAAMAGHPNASPPVYRVGVGCRWSMPADLLHFLSHPARWFGRQALGGDVRALTDDIWSLDDMGPTVAFPLIAVAMALRPEMWRMLFRW